MKSINFIAAVTIFLSTTCVANTQNSGEDNSWKTECIGRYQINLPLDVEIIISVPRALSNSSMDAKMAKYMMQSSMSSFLSNPYPAPFSHYDYYGDLGITPEVAVIDFENLRKLIKTSQIEKKKELLDEALKYEEDGYPSLAKTNKDDAARIITFDYDTPTMFGWGLNMHPRLYLYQSNRIIIYKPAQDNDVFRKKQFNSVLNDLHPRPLYDIPSQPGVCIPYGFIADDGIASSDIAVTMRLVDHPDVEILFEDGAPARDPKMAITLFFDGYVNGEKGIKADFWGYRSITMAGQNGKALFVTITRTDDTKDYGYVAYVEGDSAASSKMLYVISTASRAKGKPVSKDELKDMAEKIMSSIKPHPVQ